MEEIYHIIQILMYAVWNIFNRLYPSCPLFCLCKTNHMKMCSKYTFIFMQIKLNFVLLNIHQCSLRFKQIVVKYVKLSSDCASLLQHLLGVQNLGFHWTIICVASLRIVILIVAE